MDATTFLKNKLQELKTQITAINIRYENRKQIHIIEILPLELYNTNIEYMEVENNIIIEFEDLFPDENIIFISTDSLTEVRNCQFQI